MPIREGLLLAGCVLLAILVTVLTKVALRAVLGKGWGTPRIPIPWRFSILAFTALTAVLAGVFSLLRHDPNVALFVGALAFFLWLAVVRYREFRLIVAARRDRELSRAIVEHRGPPEAKP